MQEVYNKYISTLTDKVNDATERLNILVASHKGFTNVYKSYVKDVNPILDNLIKTSITFMTCRKNRYKIQVLMQEDITNKELYIAAIRVANAIKDIENTRLELLKLKKQFIDYDLFLALYRQVNRTIEHRCLNGEVYYTEGLGIIQVEICSWDIKVNWQKTRELKQLLLSKGVDLYDKTTGKGAKYVIYHENDTFPLWKWHRPLIQIGKSFMQYSFKPVVKIKTDDRKMSTIENTIPSIESIINHKDIGAANKLILIAKVHPQMLSNYAN